MSKRHHAAPLHRLETPREINVGADPNGSPPPGAFERVITARGNDAMQMVTFPVERGVGLVVTVENGAPVAVATRPAPWWNGIRRAWMVAGPDGEVVLAEVQLAPPHYADRVGSIGARALGGPPAVKVSA